MPAGNGTKGPRLYDWVYLELADLDPEMVGAPPGLGLWMRGLLVRRRPVDGELAFFTTWSRHVSLVMLAFALLAVGRHKADSLATPPKTTRKLPHPWSVGRCRRSVMLPTA